FFEDPGLYLKKRIFDIEMLWELYSYYAEYYWPILEPRVRELRAERKDNTWYSNFENLCKETIAYSKKQRAPYSDKTDQELRRFVASEIEL
ncbi:MAG TPA: hypothetical protein VIH59_12375, partial [Candidatus Tectomicrobia bacterium]